MIYITKLGKYNNFQKLKEYILNTIDLNKELFYKINQIAIQYYDFPKLDCANGQEKAKIENKFTNLMPCFQNSILEEFLNFIPYKLCRTRIFLAKPQKIAYSIHKDNYERIHLPISTNNHSYFSFFDPEEIQCPVMQANGDYYKVNTLVKHTFTNNGSTDRIHIVGSILN